MLMYESLAEASAVVCVCVCVIPWILGMNKSLSNLNQTISTGESSIHIGTHLDIIYMKKSSPGFGISIHRLGFGCTWL